MLGTVPARLNSPDTKQSDGATLLPQLDTAVTALTALRHLPHGEHFYHTMHLLSDSLRCTDLPQIARLRHAYTHLLTLDPALRPQIMAVVRPLRDAAIDATAFLTAAHEITQRDALLKAQSTLEDARRLAAAGRRQRSPRIAELRQWPPSG